MQVLVIIIIIQMIIIGYLAYPKIKQHIEDNRWK